MWNLLEKLRQRPDEEKKIIALFFSVAITAVIAITWGTMLFSSLGAEEKIEENTQTATPFDSLSSQINTIKNQFGDIKNFLKNKI